MAFPSSDVIRLYKSVHTWTGITAGLLLFIAFYAGALTMFKAPLARWSAGLQPVTASSIPLAQAADLIAKTLQSRPDARQQFTLELRDGAADGVRLHWGQTRSDPARSYATLGDDGGLITGREQPALTAQIIDELHRTGGVPGGRDFGGLVMAIVSALYFIALVSGVIVLLPTLVKDFLALRLGKNLKRMWLDAHNVVGVVSLPFHLVMALSGVVFGLHDEFYEAQNAVVYDGAIMQLIQGHSPYVPPHATGRSAEMLAPEQLLGIIRERSPNFEPVALTYSHAGDSAASVLVRGEDPRLLLRNNGLVLMSAVTGEVLNNYYFPGERNSWTAAVNSFFSLHFGSYGGESVRWSYFFLGLAGAFLFYSGNLLWIESRRRSDRGGASVAQKRSTRLMAAATVGVCLGCICGLSALIAASKWHNLWAPHSLAWPIGTYYLVFLGSVLWAFLRGGAKASVDLLWLAAVLTFAISATTLLAWVFSVGPHANAVALDVDITAFAGATCFALMARSTARRAKQGPTDSVWSTNSKTLPAQAPS